jgi:copper transport protein
MFFPGHRRYVAAVPGLAAALVLVLASPVSAHAELVASTPADGAHLDEAPSVVTLTFSEHVSATLGAVRVYDHKGHRVDAGDVEAQDETVTLGLQPGLADDTYIVTWRVLSADSHPVRGAFTFTVGKGAQISDAVLAVLFDEGADRPWQIAGAVARGLAYGGSLLAAGGALFLAFVDDGRGDRRRLGRTIVIGAVVGAVGVLAALPITAALATGLGTTAITKSGVLSQVLADGVGWSTLASLLGLGAIVSVARTAPMHGRLEGGRRVVAIAGSIVAVEAFVLAGHTTTTSPAWLAYTADGLHVLAAAIWSGGLVLLLLTLRARRAGGDDAVPAGQVVVRFGNLAGASVIVVALAGSALAWSEVRALHALTDTTYGRLLLVKVAFVVVVATIAGYNHYRLVPALRRAEAAGRNAWSHLRRTVRLEIAGMIVIVGLTAVLVSVTPARTAAGIGTIYASTQDLGDGSVNLVVDPNRAARTNSIHLYLLDATGRPTDQFDSVRLELSLPASDIGPLDRDPTVAGPGHFQLVTDDLSIPGKWQIDVIVTVDRFTQQTARFDVLVNP